MRPNCRKWFADDFKLADETISLNRRPRIGTNVRIQNMQCSNRVRNIDQFYFYIWVESLGLSPGFRLEKYEAWPKPTQSPQHGPGFGLEPSLAHHSL